MEQDLQQQHFAKKTACKDFIQILLKFVLHVLLDVYNVIQLLVLSQLQAITLIRQLSQFHLFK